jgi:hypothetical protein
VTPAINIDTLKLIGRSVDFDVNYHPTRLLDEWSSDGYKGCRGLKILGSNCGNDDHLHKSYTIELYNTPCDSSGILFCILCNSTEERWATIKSLFM